MSTPQHGTSPTRWDLFEDTHEPIPDRSGSIFCSCGWPKADEDPAAGAPSYVAHLIDAYIEARSA